MSNTLQLPQRPMLRLLTYLGHYKSNLWFAVSASVINKVFDLMPPILTAWVIDTASGNTPEWIGSWTGLSETWNILIFLAILIIAIFGFESLFEWMFKRSFMRLAQKVQHDLRIDAYVKLQSREIAFFEAQRTGNLMAMLNDDINQLERFLNSIFNEIIQLITLLIFAGWSLCVVSWQLGMIGMAPIPFIILGSLYYQRKVAPYYRAVREGVGRLGTRLENNISGIMVIKSFTAEDFEAERVRKASENYRDANFKAIRWSSVYVPIIRIFIAFGFAITLLIGAYWVIYEPGRFSLGSLAFFAMMIQRLLWPVTRLGTVFDEYERARASARRIFGLLDTPNQLLDPIEPKNISRIEGNITFEQVHFHYKKGNPILQGLDLQIKAGETIGIAGPTGGGKTTLIKLLLRLYDVTAGSIKVEQTDIRDIEMQELRRQIALVSQDVYLFHGSIYENIAYGRPNSTIEEVKLAAKKAKLHDFVSTLPNQYHTIVGERGIKLSGGQRQRLSIARAILKDAPILILDEATSSVDMETEKAIQENLTQLTKDKTALIIAHRLSTIREADRIIVLNKGIIAEEGPHEALLANAGIYAELWKVQLGGIEN